MTPVIIVGIIIFGVGLLVWAVSGGLSRLATNSYSYLRPGRDKETFRRRNVIGIRVVAAIWLISGFGLVIYALIARK